MKIEQCLLVCFIFLHVAVHAQVKIGNNSTSINSASLLELEATNKGLVFPRVSLTSVSSSSPLPSGLLPGTVVYNTNASVTNGNGVGLYAWNGSAWSVITPSISSAAWGLIGNTGTSYLTNFIGTTDNNGFRIRTNNVERILVDSLGSIGIGSSAFNTINREKLLIDYGTTTSHTLANLRGSTDDYFQVNLQNLSSGVSSSSDYVATADDGTDSTYYIDMGINSSTYSRAFHNWGGAHDSYLYSNSKNLLIGTATSNDIIFMANGGSINLNSVIRLKGLTGNVVVGKGDNTGNPIGNTIRGPNANGTDIAGGNITINGGNATGAGAGGSININGGSTFSGITGSVNINADNNSATNINTGTSTSGITIGNSSNNILLPKFNTTGGMIYTTAITGQIASTGSNITWDDVNNRLGIGISGPGYKLSVLSPANPLYLSGVQATSTFSADSVLTISNGIVKKVPYGALTAIGWSLTGNTGTTAGTNFIGTTDAVDFVTKTSGTERLRITSTGNLGIATASPTEKLDVTGNVKFSGALMPNNLAGTGGYLLQSSGTSAAPVWTDPNIIGWALNGNSVSVVKNLGTTSNFDLPFITNNTEAMRLTAAGYLGLGIATPEDHLHIIENTALSATPYSMVTVETRNTNTTQGSQPPQLNHIRQIPTAAYIFNTQYLGAIENFAFRVPGSATFNNFAQWQGSTMNSNGIIGFTTRTGMTNGNPATGTLTGGIATAAGFTYNMVLNGTVLGIANLLGGATTLSTDANGNIIRTPSDIKLKTNIITIDSALDKVMRLRGVSYNWKDTSRFGSGREIGFIAQEIEKVVPEVVKSGGEYKSVNYQVITALLAEAMKQQQKQIEDQQKIIDRLVQEVKELNDKIK